MAKIDIRRPQLVDTYGIGAIFDAPGMSLMISESDWKMTNLSQVDEPRLVKRLKVDRLMTPLPSEDDEFMPTVPARRFPGWCYCPKCRDFRRIADFGPVDKVTKCSRKECAGQQLIPARIVVACQAGHIDDFPWFEWAHTSRPCTAPGGAGRLKLNSRSESTSFSDLIVTCSCDASRDLGGVLLPNSLGSIQMSSCRGKSPWRRGDDGSACGQTPVRVMQRGATNVYFPIRESAVSIPPYSGYAYAVVSNGWSILKSVKSDSPMMAPLLAGLASENGVEVRELQDAIRQKLAEESGLADQVDIKIDEFSALSQPPRGAGYRDQYMADVVPAPACAASWIQSVTLIKRLRVVTAQVGFSRIEYSTDEVLMQPISLETEGIRWLPANEVRGEGIFIRVNAKAVTDWLSANGTAINARLRHMLLKAQNSKLVQRSQLLPSPQLIALHTFSHLLINELALESGYSASSIRERIYALPGSGPEEERLGVLVYTSTSDSEGSLGGLVRQGSPDRLGGLIEKAIEAARWCSNDPLCRETDMEMGQGTDGLNLSACHCCGLLPETSCELFNVMLDRMLLVGGSDFKGLAQ